MRDLDTFFKNIVSNDRDLADEIRNKRDAALEEIATTTRGLMRSPLGTGADDVTRRTRTIVLRTGRPVLPIVRNAPRVTSIGADSEIWRSRIERAADRITHAAKAVGRIEVTGHPLQLSYVGTGWLVGPTTIVTNRHVAREFSRQGTGGLTFARGLDNRPMSVDIDFLEEINDTEREFTIVEVLHVEDDDGPDVAFLKVEPKSGRKLLAEPIALADGVARKDQQVAVIGYPARDSRVPDDQLMHQIFGDVYDKKRLSPGQVIAVEEGVVQHDCSTLGGNSGSVVLDLASGAAVGLHFAGRFMQANYAVPAALVAERLHRLGRPQTPVKPPRPAAVPANIAVPSRVDVVEVFVEGAVEEYANRRGFDRDFIGVHVPLPTLTRRVDDVLTFTMNGQPASELKYEHFSVVMSHSRRLCFFSAGNIDGGTTRKGKRPGWRLDPRIPKGMQIRDECYGNEPKFARGHMTRREDPVWGTAEVAARGNSDSMHVTNTVPQMQPFNGGIWLALEDYALEHAREDSMRVSVITGPFLEDDDPVRYGVKIPPAFWKVIAFIHDATGKLSATGYTMSQDAFLRPEEFVFAQHRTTQARIADIERRTGLSFGPLAAADPFVGGQEGVATSLTDPSQIRFV